MILKMIELHDDAQIPVYFGKNHNTILYEQASHSDCSGNFYSLPLFPFLTHTLKISLCVINIIMTDS